MSHATFEVNGEKGEAVAGSFRSWQVHGANAMTSDTRALRLSATRYAVRRYEWHTRPSCEVYTEECRPTRSIDYAEKEARRVPFEIATAVLRRG